MAMVALVAMAASLVRPVWASAPPATVDAPAWRTAAHERFGDTDVYLLEDGTYLYVAFSAAKAAGDGDAVKLYLWSDKAAYAFSVDAHGARSASCSAGAQPDWSAGEQPTSGGGYAVTMRLPETLFRGRARWLVQFARVTAGAAYTWPESGGAPGNVLYANAFDGRAAQPFRPAASPAGEPKVAAPAKIAQLWPSGGSPVAPPAISAGATGVAVSQEQDNVRFTGVGAKTQDGREQDAQALSWLSPDGHTTAALTRTASGGAANYDVAQGLSLAFDNGQNVRVSAGVAADRGSNVDDASQANYSYYDFSLYGQNGNFEMRWNTAGPQYSPTGDQAPPPGTTGYTLSASREFGNVSVNAAANRYRDDLGNLADADERAAISDALSPAFTFDMDAALSAATQYTTLPYVQSGAQLQYSSGARQASVSYHEDRYAGGLARELSITGGFTVPVIGMLQFSHRQTDMFGAVSLTEPQQGTSAALMRRFGSGSISVGYQYAPGDANVTFSFEDRLPIGLLRATYYNPNTLFSSPNFAVKFVNL